MSDRFDGLLEKNDIGRWCIGIDDQVTSGEVIEVDVAGHWITTRVEYGGNDYYAVAPGVQLYEGMKARRIK